MNKLRRSLYTVAAFAILAGALMLTSTRPIQGENPANVRVINTSAEAVPVNIQGAVGISGAIQAQQSGAWTVGINGTPTVRIDPLNNLVRTGTKLVFNQSIIGIPTAGMDVPPIDISGFSKIRVSVVVNGSGEIRFFLRSGTNEEFPAGYPMDNFTVSSGGGTLTRTYDVAGETLRIKLDPTDANNQAIIGVFGS